MLRQIRNRIEAILEKEGFSYTNVKVSVENSTENGQEDFYMIEIEEPTKYLQPLSQEIYQTPNCVLKALNDKIEELKGFEIAYHN